MSEILGALEKTIVTEIDQPHSYPSTIGTLPGMIGSSAAIRKVYRLVHMVAQRDTPVLITGETGTGKELIAHAIHQLSSRSQETYMVINCAAIPEELFESELFGHTRGAFTGAMHAHEGKITAAQNGTLFLDEIGELPLNMQAKLLRFLQNGEIQRLGSVDTHHVDVRLICATNLDLLELTQKKKFREDLYYRLNAFPITVPPLRERREDIVILANYFLMRVLHENKVPMKHLSLAVIAYLENHTWKGNVRELKYAIERAVILAQEKYEIGIEHFPTDQKSDSKSPENDLPLNLAKMEKLTIQRALLCANGNKMLAAEILGIGKTTLYRKLALYGEQDQTSV